MESDDSYIDEGKNRNSRRVKLTRSAEKAAVETARKLHPVIMQQLMQPRCKSSVWVYFQRLDTSLAKCRICHGNYRFGSSISNLRHHAEIKHSDILKQGPVKFLEWLKVPKEQVAKFVQKTQKPRKTRSAEVQVPTEDPVVKNSPISNVIDEHDDSSIGDEDVYDARGLIYEKGEETICDYMRSPKCPTPASSGGSNTPYLRSSLHDDDEPTIALLRAEEFMKSGLNSNPLNNTTTALNSEKLHRLQEERLQAETNYLNKKATYLERSTEFVEVQKRHVMLQTKKLELEIAAMKEGLHSE